MYTVINTRCAHINQSYQNITIDFLTNITMKEPNETNRGLSQTTNNAILYDTDQTILLPMLNNTFPNKTQDEKNDPDNNAECKNALDTETI